MRILSITLPTLLSPVTALPEQQASGEAIRAAEASYPDLAIKDSAFHKLFTAEVVAARKGYDPVMRHSTWPLEIAHRIAAKMQVVQQ